MKINKYPDGSSYVISDVELMGKINHNITFKVNNYEDLWHLNQYVDAFWNFNKQKPTITIPNLIDAQADRRFNKDESSGLKLVCKFLNSMKANFKIFHPHNPEVVEALMDNVEIIDNSKFVFTVIDRLNELYGSKQVETNYSKNKLILMSSDAGGFKPLMKLCDKLQWQGETFSASKYREAYNNGKGTLIQEINRKDFGGKDILIIDDLSVYGGTFKGLAKLLRERNVGKLYLAISHMTVQNLGEDSVTNYFDKVFTTNSKFDSYHYEIDKGELINIFNKNLEIIKLF